MQPPPLSPKPAVVDRLICPLFCFIPSNQSLQARLCVPCRLIETIVVPCPSSRPLYIYSQCLLPRDPLALASSPPRWLLQRMQLQKQKQQRRRCTNVRDRVCRFRGPCAWTSLIDRFRLFYLQTTKKEVRRRQTTLQGMPPLGPTMRIQATDVVEQWS